MEESINPLVQPHRRLNPKMQEVVKAKTKTSRCRLVIAPVLISPDWDLPFEVMCDASDSAVGAILGQRVDKVFRTIYYARKTLNEAQLNYAINEKEFLAVVFALEKFHSYLNDIEDIDDWFPDEKLFFIENSPWYDNFSNYLVTGTLPHNLYFHQKKKFLSDVKHYFWEKPFLFKICAYSMIWRCVAEGEMKSILSHCHDHEVGSHAEPIKTAVKVLECGFYWPNLFKDARYFVFECDRCQQTGEKRLLELNQLEEFQYQAYDMAVSYKEMTKRIHDRRIHQREFKEGEAVIFFNSRLRLFPGKLKSRWSGPYKITKVYPSGAIEIKDARNESFTINAQRLKHYVGGDVDSTPVITTLTDQD
ncbi:uncharacterized protein [Henckelia pumila]|uniref:uncharacterized protein n=1 Tax=Henckelia pumila TaxID=405737 RepID=UPI003C6E8FB4